MEVKTDINDVYDLKDKTWSGGYDTVKDILDLDYNNNTNYGDRLFSHLEEVFMFDEETPSMTSVNDYLWFERDAIYESIGLNKNGEIPTSVDEAKAEGTTWGVDFEAIEKMEETGLFEKDFIKHLKEQLEEDEDEEGNKTYDKESVYYFDFDELNINQEQEVTEEQVDYLNDNC